MAIIVMSSILVQKFAYLHRMDSIKLKFYFDKRPLSQAPSLSIESRMLKTCIGVSC